MTSTSDSEAHYIGIDVGTGSARSCIISNTGSILAVHSQEIKLWNPKTGYYVNLPPPSSLAWCVDVNRNNQPQISGKQSARPSKHVYQNPRSLQKVSKA